MNTEELRKAKMAEEAYPLFYQELTSQGASPDEAQKGANQLAELWAYWNSLSREAKDSFIEGMSLWVQFLRQWVELEEL